MELPGEMEMNIKFEWRAPLEGLWFYYLHGIQLGAVFDRGNGKFLQVFHGEPECLESPVCATLDEAKAWVEEQARAWLAEVTA